MGDAFDVAAVYDRRRNKNGSTHDLQEVADWRFLDGSSLCLGAGLSSVFRVVGLPAGTRFYVPSTVAARIRFSRRCRLSRFGCRFAILSDCRLDFITGQPGGQIATGCDPRRHLAFCRRRPRGFCRRDAESDLGIRLRRKVGRAVLCPPRRARSARPTIQN